MKPTPSPKPGRVLDAWIAKHFMAYGLRQEATPTGHLCTLLDPDGREVENRFTNPDPHWHEAFERIPRFSTYMSHSWQVMEKLKTITPKNRTTFGHWVIAYGLAARTWEIRWDSGEDGYEVFSKKESLEYGICLAARRVFHIQEGIA